MIIALAQLNPTVGDFAGNSAKILEFAQRAAQRGADLAVFSELCLGPVADSWGPLSPGAAAIAGYAARPSNATSTSIVLMNRLHNNILLKEPSHPALT